MFECRAKLAFKFQSLKSKVGLRTSSNSKDSNLVAISLGLRVLSFNHALHLKV